MNAYNTGAVTGTTMAGFYNSVGGVAGCNDGTIANTWYATTDALGNTINTSTSSVSFDPTGIDTSHIYAYGGVGTEVGSYAFTLYSDQQGYDLVDSGDHTFTITPKTTIGTNNINGFLGRNYSDALTSFSSFFGANPSDGYTIFSGAPEDYIARAVIKNNGQSYQVGVAQVTQTWYNGPTTITIVNGGITLPKDILLGSTPDTSSK